MWVTGGGNNSAKYSSAEYDKLMTEDIYKETDNSKRMEVFANAEKVILKDMPIAPVFYYDNNRFLHNYVKGAEFPLFGASYELKYAYTEGRQ
jgi:oligopeptide transport system substrate-binding protein